MTFANAMSEHCAGSTRPALPGLRTGEVGGRTVRWFVAALPLYEPGGSRP